MTPAHYRLAEIVNLLPYSRAEVAKHLEVSLPTLQGWLRAAREPLTKRQPGYAPPSVEALKAAQALLIDHTTECQDALAKDPTVNTYDSLNDAIKRAGPTLVTHAAGWWTVAPAEPDANLGDGLGYVGPFLHGPELDGGGDAP
jgi:hypothetical protein